MEHPFGHHHHHHHHQHREDDQQEVRSVVHVSHEPRDEWDHHHRRSAMKVQSKVDPNFVIAIRDDRVILARADPSDESQQWYKDEKYSARVKDSEGSPSFSLINKFTNQAIKHSVGASHPVQLVPYSPEDSVNESILWSLSQDIGGGFRSIRMINISLNFDALHGDEGVYDGTLIVLWDWNRGHNQQWIIEPIY